MASKGRRLKVVGLGDSTTAGTPGFLSPLESPPGGKGDERSQYAYWLKKAHPEWEVLNRGINGERTDQILHRFQSDAASEKPDLIVILAGVNDIYQGYPVDFSAQNLQRMYSLTIEARSTPIACSVLPYNTMTEKAANSRKTLNEWIRDASERLAIPFADTARAAGDPRDPDRLAGTPDGFHPDIEGYRKMAVEIAETIEGNILRSSR